MKSKSHARTSPKEVVRITPEIRALYKRGNVTQQEIADRFGICAHTVRKVLPSQDRETRRKTKKQSYSMICEGIIEEWKTGDYSVNQLAERWGRNRVTIGNILRSGGISTNNHEYRDKRISELYAAGHDRKTLAKRFELTERYVVMLAWRGSADADQRICPVCKEPFPAKRKNHRYCSRKCIRKLKAHKATCSVCRKPFLAYNSNRQSCGKDCRAVLGKIRSMERDLRIRELRREGCTHREIQKIVGFSLSLIGKICAKGTHSEYLSAIEIVRRHRDQAWLSGFAKLEVRRAAKVLKKHGLERYA